MTSGGVGRRAIALRCLAVLALVASGCAALGPVSEWEIP
jgi:hypothetical protein